MENLSYKKRLAALREKLNNKSPDALWIIQPENRRYLSGFKAGDMQLTESSGSLFISKKKALLVTDSRYAIEAQKEAKDFEVVVPKRPLIKEIPFILKRLKTKVLGFEENYITWRTHQDLLKEVKGLYPRVRLSPSQGLVEEMRKTKDRSELGNMKKASDMMSDILNKIISRLRPGQTEMEIAGKIKGLCYDSGAEGLAFPPIVASGPNGALPHAVPTKRKIRPKEPIIFDVGLKWNGYCCDMTRTVFLGTPGPKFRKIYRTVREAQLSALKEVKPDVDSTFPDSVARNIIKDAGFGDYFGHSLGHGVGLAAHEAPGLSPRNPVKLKKDNVVTVEPGIYIPGQGGVRLEEMVAVGKNGARILTKNSHFYDF